ncbi:hypothetical protein HK097_007433 [Rhizophlyctis rosea]|uniref:Uroporphyrinogen-III synthase n=1 Tax=Rhizophlyctis rosea TaxID=64517 RepID=A0AAD5SD59_9FUNG|nr:hypothetical protein HK097_007433 [Rhizophlyctis rosea]
MAERTANEDLSVSSTEASTKTKDAQLTHCFELLSSAARDEDKFVGLMLLARVLDPNDLASVQRAFEAIPWKFISRLLITRETSTELPIETLHAIAVNIMNAFSIFDELVSRPELITRARLLADLLTQRHQEDLTTSILQSLLRMGSSRPVELIQEGVPVVLAMALPLITKEGDREMILQAIQLLAGAATTSAHHSAFLHALPPLASVFASDQTALKFQVLNILVQILTTAGDQSKSTPGWEDSIRVGLKDVFGSKISQTQRDLSLVLSSIMIRTFGPTWMFGASPDSKGKTTSRLSHAQFGTILLHIACAEVRVTLDDLTDQDRFDDTDRPAHLLPACYEILEGTMQFLVDEDGVGEVVLTTDGLLSIRGALREAFASVGAFLVERMARFQARGDFHVFDNIVTAFSLRASGTYLGEETDVPAKEVNHVVPALVTAARSRLTSIDMHPVEFLTPAFTNITADDETRQSFVDAGGFPILVNYLQSQNPPQQIAIAILGILLNVVVSRSLQLQHVAETLTLVQVLTEKYGLPDSLTDNQESIILAANAATLTVFILRDLSAAQIRTLGSQTIRVAQDRAAGFVVSRKRLEATGSQIWQDVSELWFLTVNAWADFAKNQSNRVSWDWRRWDVDFKANRDACRTWDEEERDALLDLINILASSPLPSIETLNIATTKKLILLCKDKNDGSDDTDTKDDPYENLLSEQGFTSLFLPVLEHVPANVDQIAQLLSTPDAFAGLIVTSKRSFHTIGIASQDNASLITGWKTKPVYVVGDVTAQAAITSGFSPKGQEVGRAELLAEVIIKDRERFNAKPLLFLAGSKHRDTLPTRLGAANIGLKTVIAYETQSNSRVGSDLERMVEGREGIRWVAFFSPLGVETALPVLRRQGWWSGMRVVVIGGTTAAKVREYGVEVSAQAEKPCAEGIVKAILDVEKKA